MDMEKDGLEPEWPHQLNPETTATEALKIGMTVESYNNGVQADRRRRLETFKKCEIPFLVRQAEDLIKFGDEVMRLMKEKADDQKV